MARAILVSRNVFVEGYEPEHLNSRGFIKYMFCKMMCIYNKTKLINEYEQ